MPPVQPLSDSSSLDGRTLPVPMIGPCASFYADDRTTGVTHVNGKIVVRVLETIPTESEDAFVADGAPGVVTDGIVACPIGSEDEFAAAIERLTHCHVVAFLSATQTAPGVACGLFFLGAAPLASPPSDHHRTS